MNVRKMDDIDSTLQNVAAGRMARLQLHGRFYAGFRDGDMCVSEIFFGCRCCFGYGCSNAFVGHINEVRRV